MPSSQAAQSEKYVEFANYCLQFASTTKDEGSRKILREMAAEWLHLAERALEN